LGPIVLAPHHARPKMVHLIKYAQRLTLLLCISLHNDTHTHTHTPCTSYGTFN